MEENELYALSFNTPSYREVLSLAPQFICYSWLSGIADVALVVFVRKQTPGIQYLKAAISETVLMPSGAKHPQGIIHIVSADSSCVTTIRFELIGKLR